MSLLSGAGVGAAIWLEVVVEETGVDDAGVGAAAGVLLAGVGAALVELLLFEGWMLPSTTGGSG